jgi:FixJ family two-component response regulator
MYGINERTGASLTEQYSLLQLSIVDDDPAVLDALKTTFENEGFLVCTFISGDAFLRAPRQPQPDCLLLDVSMLDRSGLDVLEAIGGRNYPAPIIMISGRNDIAIAVAATRAGAEDFIVKPLDAASLVERVRTAIRMRRERLEQEQQIPRRRYAGTGTLTPREFDVLDQLTSGQSNKAVARLLGISPRTVEVHRARIMEKVGARNTADLMRIVLGGHG